MCDEFPVENESEPNKKNDERDQYSSGDICGRFEDVVKLNPAENRHFNHEEKNS